MRTWRQVVISVAILIAMVTATLPAAPAGDQADLAARVDRAVEEIISRTGAPSASIAVVRDGQLTLAKAYGHARLEPAMPARPDMRYSIGSISKQFTAAAVLLLAEDSTSNR